MEFQKRGAPHFHLVLANLPFIQKGVVQEWWGAIIGHDKPFTRIEAVKDEKVLKYVCKYVAKSGDAEEESACGYDTLLKPQDTEQLPPTGRVWGVFNKPALPEAEQHTVTRFHAQWYHDLKEKARDVWPGIEASTPDGFTLFKNDAAEWLDENLDP